MGAARGFRSKPRSGMPDPDPSRVTQTQPSVGLKIVALAAGGIILSLGLCKLGFYLGRNVYDGAPSTIDILGGIAFLLSIFVLAVGVLIAILEAISNRVEKRKS
jgi:hypothetical protein